MPAPVVSRLYPLRPHPVQAQLMSSTNRFVVVPAGRRSGKTELAKRKLVREALAPSGYPDARYFAAAPTRDQAKAIYWYDLKAMFPRQLMAEVPRESELTISLWNGAVVSIIGMDKPQRIEGRPWNGGILDESADMKPSAFTENVRPALSDRAGWCWMIGVPEGRNHYYDFWKYAISGADPEWAGFTWPSADILPASEIASAKRLLDPLVFQQEYEASFVNFEGRIYYPFTEATHCKPLKYDPLRTLAFCFDFNVDPGVAVIVQEQVLPGQFERRGSVPLLDKPITGTGVIGEVYIERNSNTPAVCRKLIADWGKHQARVVCYGDASGGHRATSQVTGSDWDLIKELLGKAFGNRISYSVPSHNPTERARINAVNSRLLASDGITRLLVDPVKAPHVVKDFEGVRALKGGSGEIDKMHDLRLTHLTDGIGYYVAKEFPVRNVAPIISPFRV